MIKTVYEVYSHLWSDEVLISVKKIIKTINVVHLPEENHILVDAPVYNTVIVISNPTLFLEASMLAKGFRHCISKEREDFAFELLMASLMCYSPTILTKNKLPFSFANFGKENSETRPGVPLTESPTFYFSGISTEDKKKLLEDFSDFLKSTPRTSIIHDLAIEIADELFLNAFFHSGATRNKAGKLTVMSRSDDFYLYADKEINFFATIDESSLTLGCQDPYGKLDRKKLTDQLLQLYATDMVTTKLGPNGSKIGLKMVVDNAASTYFYCEKDKKTIVACTLLLKGLLQNLKLSKHLHLISIDN